MLVTDLIFKNAGIIGQAASRVPQEAGRVPPGLPWEKFLSASAFHELPGGPDNVQVPQGQEHFFFPLLLGVAPPGGPGRQAIGRKRTNLTAGQPISPVKSKFSVLLGCPTALPASGGSAVGKLLLTFVSHKLPGWPRSRLQAGLPERPRLKRTHQTDSKSRLQFKPVYFKLMNNAHFLRENHL